MKKEKEFYKRRYHPQRNFSKANVRLYNLILDLDVKTIFEFGCGVGRHLERLSDWGYDVAGMDISNQCIKEAKENGLKVFTGDETKLSKFKEYDLVFTNSVLCHMSDPTEALRELKRMAKKYLITVECISKENDYWWVHEYEGKLIHTIDSHLNNGATYNIYLCEF